MPRVNEFRVEGVVSRVEQKWTRDKSKQFWDVVVDTFENEKGQVVQVPLAIFGKRPEPPARGDWLRATGHLGKRGEYLKVGYMRVEYGKGERDGEQ